MAQQGELEQAIEQVVDGMQAASEAARLAVVEYATQLVEALQGTTDDVSVSLQDESDTENNLGLTPQEMPEIAYTSHPGGSEINVVASLGHYFVDAINSDVDPALMMNAGFYAGVLATSMGLVDAEQFNLRSDQPES